MLIFKNQPLVKIKKTKKLQKETKETKKVIEQGIKITKAIIKYWKFNLKISKNELGENFCKWMIKEAKENLKDWKKNETKKSCKNCKIRKCYLCKKITIIKK